MRALEIFACSGGLAAGFREAGIEFDLAFDVDPDACASYEKNLGHAPIQLDVRDLIRMVRSGWSPGPIDLLAADPPCAPWSRAGKRRGLDDERDMLRETVELIRLLRPRAYLIGNIPGLDDAPHRRIVQATIGGLARAGYCVVDYASLDAADYGVPQHRVRPFWFGHLDGPCITWPAPTHADPRTLGQTMLVGIESLRPWVTCRDALACLPVEEIGRPVRVGGPRPAARKVGKSAPSTKGYQSSRVGDIDRPAPTLGATVGRVGAGAAHVYAWPWDRPSTTIHEDPRIAGPHHHTRSNLSGPNAIVLSERAAAILQGFPDGWHFAGATKGARWAQIGMAVPPPLAAAIGRSVRRAIEAREKACA